MRLALFDLDHTLIPFDSGFAWTNFLIERGHRPAAAADEYIAFAHQYVAGTLDIHAMHRACVLPLREVPRAQLAQWQADYAAAMAPRVPAEMLALVARHREAGDVCAIVTATTRLVCEPLARLYGVHQLLCTEAALDGTPPHARPTGEIDGEPCYREAKISHVERWLQAQGLPPLARVAQSHFYSDSASDLPLLQAVTHPVAVRPDARLRAHAQQAGWPVMD